MVPAWFAFALGILIDLVSGLPLGLNALLFVMVARVIQDQRKIFMGQPFFSVYFGYTLVSVGVEIMQWGIFCMVGMKWVAIEPALGAVLLGVAFFPLAFLLMNITHKILPHDMSVMK